MLRDDGVVAVVDAATIAGDDEVGLQIALLQRAKDIRVGTTGGHDKVDALCLEGLDDGGGEGGYFMLFVQKGPVQIGKYCLDGHGW